MQIKKNMGLTLDYYELFSRHVQDCHVFFLSHPLNSSLQGKIKMKMW